MKHLSNETLLGANFQEEGRTHSKHVEYISG